MVGPVTSALIGAICLGLAWNFGWALATTAISPVVGLVTTVGFLLAFILSKLE